MWPHDDVVPVDLAAALSQIANYFFARVELRAGWLVAIEVSHQTNAERNVVQIIAVHMTAVDLAPPPVSYLNLAVAGRCPIANHEVIGEAILHPADMPMVIIEDARVSLPCPAIVDNDKLPTTSLHRRAADLFDHRSRQITVGARTAPGPRPKTSTRWRGWQRFETLICFETGFLYDNLRSLFRRNSARNI